jgi:hypothetical protein
MVESRIDIMSTATSLAKPLVRPITLCPYCDHVSPAGSKFCGACGAALHLMPCPHCGAVNDITVSTECYRCHSDLHENATVVLPSPAPTEIAEPEKAPVKTTPYVTLEPAARQRPHALVVGIVLIAFAAASYYAYRQRGVISARESAQAETKNRSASDTGTNAGTGTIIKAPENVVVKPPISVQVANKDAAAIEAKGTKPDAEAPHESSPSTGPESTSTARSNVGKPVADRETGGSATASSGAAPDIARARIDASKGLDQQKPAIGPCTEAVAALGLCTPEPTTRRQ